MSESETEDIEQRVARLEQQDQRLTRALELLVSRASTPTARARRNWDAYAAVIAALIGVLALALSGYTAYVQRQQLRAQVWPHLELVYSNVNLSVFITNQGTGPARVTAMRVTIDGKPVKDWFDVQVAAGFTGGDHLVRSGLGGRVVPAGKDQSVIKPSDSDTSRAKFLELLPGGKHAISVLVCYCSVLDECWTTSLGVKRDTDQAISPDACPIADSERFRE